MKAIVLLMIISVIFTANIRSRQHYEYSFEQFIRNEQKKYATPEEYIYRLQIFADNLDKIELHNSRQSSYSLAVNKFADLTVEEFKQSVLSKPKVNNYKSNNIYYSKNINIPSEVDWSSKGAVTGVKDQGACGSCWSFGTTGALEGAYFLKNNKLLSFSEQQLVDCSSAYGNEGCNGGITGWAYEYIKDHGLCTEEDYPYHARDEKCKTSCKTAVEISSYVIVDTNEVALAEAIAERPVAVDFDATLIMFYEKGIVDGDCPIELTHSILGVGYGEENGKKYWKMKNSWGKNWGENGYFRIVKDSGKKEGECGLVLNSVYPIL